MPARPVTPAESDESEQLVAVGRVADEARALLVLADRDEHAADGERWKRHSASTTRKPTAADEDVIGQGWLEIDAEHAGRAMPPRPFSPPVSAVQRKATA